MQTKPNFFIFGAPKCSTTAFNAYLKRHPDVFIPERKEIHFFGRDLKLDGERPSLEAYLALFAPSASRCAIGESSVFYLFSRTAADEIYSFNPDARIIIMLRDPIDMVHSLYYQNYWYGYEVAATLKTAPQLEHARRRGNPVPPGAPPHALLYTEIGQYSRQIERYFKAVFGRDRVHIVFYDNLRRDITNEYLRVLSFLGVDVKFETSFEVINANKEAFSPRLQRFLAHPPNWVLSAGRKLLPRVVRNTLRKDLRRMNTKEVRRPAMDDSLMRELCKVFAADLQRLRTLLHDELPDRCQGS